MSSEQKERQSNKETEFQMSLNLKLMVPKRTRVTKEREIETERKGIHFR